MGSSGALLTGGGGGGGSGASGLTDDPGLWTPANAADYEFNNTLADNTFGTGWTSVGDAVGVSFKEAFGAGLITVPPSTAGTFSMRRDMTPGTSWSIIAKVSWSFNVANFAGVGLYALHKASSTSLTASYNFTLSNTTPLKISPYFQVSGVSGSEITADPLSTPATREMYLRLRKNSATSYDFHWSVDGLSWRALQTAFNPGANLGGSPDAFGFNAFNSGAGISHHYAIHWVRVR